MSLCSININMSEVCEVAYDLLTLFHHVQRAQFHDRHTISRLIGAAPGYIGFEEGGKISVEDSHTLS